MQFAVIASGSDGNAALVRSGGQALLIDCGVSYRRLIAGLARLDVRPEQIAGIALTHEHGDHVCGLPPYLARHEATVLTAPATIPRLRSRRSVEELGRFDWWGLEPGRPVWFGNFEVLPLATRHDARRPLGFCIEAEGARLAYATDTGETTADVLDCLRGSDVIAVESNHCPEMLRTGPYPRRLKARIHSPLGHLSNYDAARLVRRVASERLHSVVALHLSRTNNTPALAADTLRAELSGVGASVAVTTADRRGTGWIDVRSDDTRRGASTVRSASR